jgi:adenylosuccinate synthase
VHHIHVTAEPDELKQRYEKRRKSADLAVAYDELKRKRTERNIEQLADVADIVVATDHCTEEAVLVRATALLNLYPRRHTRLVDVIVGGQFGSEGKGNIVGHIASEYDLLVRASDLILL